MNIQPIENIYKNINHIPKADLEALKSPYISAELASLLEHTSAQDTFEGAASVIEHASVLEHGADLIEAFGNLTECIYVLSILIRLVKPVKDVMDGNYLTALKRTAVSAVDIAVAKARLVVAGLGALKGLALKMQGIDTPNSGIWGGYMSAIKGWGKGRRAVENFVIDPEKFIDDFLNDPKEIAEDKYRRGRENYLTDYKNRILDKSQKMEKNIENWKKTKNQQIEIQHLYLDEMAKIENVIEEASANYLNAAKQDRYTVGAGLQFLKASQKNIDDEYASTLNEIKKAMKKVSPQSVKYKIMQEVENFSTKLYENESKEIDKSIKQVEQIVKFNEKIESRTKQTGLNRIAGYENIKYALRNKFLLPLQSLNAGENVKLPNAIILYGPKGCGKTLFSKAIDEEAKCNVINLEQTLDSMQDFKNLKDAAETAKSKYEKEGIYTIIHMDEIDGFLGDEIYNRDELKNILNTLSDNHCTIIGTTNYLNRINPNLVSLPNSEVFHIAPPDKKNIQEVLKYYIEDFADSDIDYHKLSELIRTKAGNNYHSNSTITAEIIKGLFECVIKNNNPKINQEYAETVVSKIEPDIKKATIENYK